MATLKAMIAALEPRIAGNPAAMLSLARMLRKDGQEARALALCSEAVAQSPHDAGLAAQALELVNASVPRWHFAIVRDEARNAAYDTALRRAIQPQSRVLEIGAGTGVLAMMAARAGAAHVTTCEMSPAIAEKAREIVAHNGYGDRIRVVAKKSGALDVEADLGGRADVLVSEIVSNNLLGEDVLAAHEHAMRHLMKSGAKVIPARGAIRVALAHDTRGAGSRLGEIAGFDLSPFNSFANTVRTMPVGDQRLVSRSEPQDLFNFDFASPDYCPAGRSTVVCRSLGGLVSGVAQWISLELDEVTRYENQPGPGRKSCWAVLFYPFPTPMETTPGEAVRICGAHNRSDLSIWREG